LTKNNKLPLRVEEWEEGLKKIYDYAKIFFEVPIPGGPLEKNIDAEEVTAKS